MSSPLVTWLKEQAEAASAVEGIKKDWLCTAALVTAIERMTEALDRTNSLLETLCDRNTK